MSTYPMVNQLQTFTADGQPDENSRMNCVPASLASALDYLTSGGPYSPDALKDHVYGQGYTGPQSAAHYAPYVQTLGIQIVAHNGDGAQLVTLAHSILERGFPCIATIPSQWATPYPDPLHPSGSTHVVAFYPDPTAPAGTLSAMNPWGGFRQNQPDSWWSPRLCFGQIWAVWLAPGVVTPLQQAHAAIAAAQAQLTAALAALAKAGG